MAKREKKPVMAVKTIEEAEVVMGEYATADAKIAKITAEMDAQFTKIRDKFAEELQALNETKEEKFNTLQMFAQSNTELFEKRKSVNMVHGLIGFRTGMPKLKLLKKQTWGSALVLLKAFLPEYVRTVEEPAKDLLLADREVPEVAKLMPKCGVEVVQEESFYVDLKKEGE